jgi:hypothetical protein
MTASKRTVSQMLVLCCGIGCCASAQGTAPHQQAESDPTPVSCGEASPATPAHLLQRLAQNPRQDQPALSKKASAQQISSNKRSAKHLQPGLSDACTLDARYSTQGAGSVIDTHRAVSIGEGLTSFCSAAVTLTSTRVAQSAQMPRCAAGGAMRVPKDHSATPAINTLAPPILHSTNTREQAPQPKWSPGDQAQPSLCPAAQLLSCCCRRAQPTKAQVAAACCCCIVSTHFVEMYPAGTCVRE